MSKLTGEDVGIVLFGLVTPPAVMSMYLPSPSTAYDKASGQIASGPQSIALLRRGEVVGALVSIAIAAAASLLAAQTELGAKAAWVFVGAVVILGLFLWEYEAAFKKGAAEREGMT